MEADLFWGQKNTYPFYAFMYIRTIELSSPVLIQRCFSDSRFYGNLSMITGATDSPCLALS